MTHSFRASALEKEKSYSLTDSSLIIKNLETEKEQTLDYSKIAKVKLKFLAKRSMPDDFLCYLTTKGGKEIIIKSQHFKGLADFENRAATYTPFIKALHKKLSIA